MKKSPLSLLSLLVILLTISLSLAGTESAEAAIAGVEWTGTPGNVGVTSGSFTLGYSFRASTSIIVTHLGVYDHGGDGLFGEYTVGLWASAAPVDAPPIDTVTVGQGTASDLVGHFRYAELATPIVLDADVVYVVAAGGLSGTGDNFVWNVSDFTEAPQITFLDNRYTTDWAKPVNVSTDDVSNGFFGGNFLFTTAAVPEPTTLAIWGTLSGLGLIAARRRRRQLA